MNYVFSVSNGGDTCLPNHYGYIIIHAFIHGGSSMRTRTDAAMSPSIAMYAVSTCCATKTSPKKEAQIAQQKITAITVPSV